MTDPKQLRKKIITARDTLSSEKRKADSETIKHNLLELPEIKNSSIIFVYISFRSEVETMQLVDELIAMGKTVTVPITYVKERRLDAIHITEPNKELVPGYCNIPEPHPDILTSQKVKPEVIEAIILPGSVFDERCGRFGYGGGFYDRFVSQVPQAHRIGLAFEAQMVEKAPLQNHDELLDIVVTEKRLIRGKR